MTRRLSDTEIAAQVRKASASERRAAQTEPRAKRAHYEAAARRIVVELTNGCVFSFPTKLVQGLRGAPAQKLRRVEVYAGGAALRWDGLDVDLGLSGLLMGIFGTRGWMAELGRIGGSATSRAKANAARRNGAKGGRPRAV